MTTVLLLLLLQVHSLIGDYHTGLQALYPLNLFDKAGLFTASQSGAHISLYYYASFAYLMLQRYTDSGRCVTRGMLFELCICEACTHIVATTPLA
jgi:RNA polymerase I-associated factor PAF67